LDRCLVLGSGLGNKVEILSHVFDEVYSVETMDELLMFQNKRCNEANLTNVIYVKSKIETLPFTDNFFDLIILGTSFSEFMQYNAEQANSTKILNEIKRILKTGGCACFDILNQTRYNFIFGKDYTVSNEREMKRLGYDEFSQIFKNIGFKLKTFWVLPSSDRPYFSTNIEDGLAIKWYLKNFKSFLKETKIQWKHQIFYRVFPLFGEKISKHLTKKFAPHFVFCCYKEKISESLEDYILKQTDYTSCVTNSRRIKTVFILLNKSGKPEQIVHCKRYGGKFPAKISFINRVFPKMANTNERIWIENWKDGRTLNPTNNNEIIEAIKWLIKFQDDSVQDRLVKNDIIDDINMMKDKMKKFDELNKNNYKNWLKEYEEFILENDIKKTAVHGDFWYTNMLYDIKHKKVNLIDWENYKLIGNPFVDLITFIIRLMMLSSTNEVQMFKTKMNDNGNFKKLMLQICNLINNHFKCNVDVILLIKIVILRTVTLNIKYKNDAYYTYSKLLHIIEKNNCSFCIDGEK